MWAATMKTQAPMVSFGIYLDDRTIWHVGAADAQTLKEAMAKGRMVDRDFGLEEHPGKRELFGNTGGAVESLKEYANERQGAQRAILSKCWGSRTHATTQKR